MKLNTIHKEHTPHISHHTHHTYHAHMHACTHACMLVHTHILRCVKALRKKNLAKCIHLEIFDCDRMRLT